MAITGTISKVGDSINVSYSGDIQSYTVPKSGTYKLEVWGGQGGNVTQTNINTLKSGGGKGGYSQGEIVLTAGQILYIGCGGEGTFASFATHTVSTLAGGYNGGGDGGITGGFPWNHRASGGGATHIALGSNRGVLANYESYKSEILIVAGGGGGGSTRKGYGGDGSYYEYLWASGGFGGGIEGGSGAGFTDDGTNNVYSYGTQTEGGHYGTNAGHIAGFGRGLSGGGGGWYGGYGTDSWAAGGGSGYIDGLDKGSTIIGINEGNGKATITYVSTSTTTSNMAKFDYTGGIQSYTVPETGIYKLEVWGASGGRHRSHTYGGLGGYSYGTIELTKGQVLYIGCGGVGAYYPGNTGNKAGGYNGGGGLAGTTYKAYQKSSGGGATHIALGSNRGVLANYASYKSEILIVAGGGGGGGQTINNINYGNEASHEHYSDITYSSGGGTNGNNGTLALSKTSIGASQTAGGTCDFNKSDNVDHNGSFGTGGSVTYPYAGAGGGGWYGGAGGYQGGSGSGGSGYIGGVTDGATFACQNTGNGMAVITLIKKSAPHCYIGSNEVSAIYIGSVNVTEAFIGLSAVS